MNDYSPPVSEKITKIVDYWIAQGRRTQINKLADHIVRNNSTYDTLIGMGIVATALEKVGITNKPNSFGPIWMVKVGDFNLFFYGTTEDEVIKRFDQLKPVKAAPDKVMIKMIADKMSRIKYALGYTKTQHKIVKDYKYADVVSQADNILAKGLDSMQKCLDAMEFVKKHTNYNFDSEIEFINTPRYQRDDLFKEAWDLILIKGVMDS